jgi:hypothetical protein
MLHNANGNCFAIVLTVKSFNFGYRWGIKSLAEFRTQKKKICFFFQKKMGIKIVETLFDKKTYPEHRMVFYEVIFYSALTSQSLGK